MSKTVYKYPIPIKTQKFSLLLPKGWKFLSAMIQNDQPFLWAEVVDGVERIEQEFSMYGTGQEIPNNAAYLTTFSIGPFVMHLYIL